MRHFIFALLGFVFLIAVRAQAEPAVELNLDVLNEFKDTPAVAQPSVATPEVPAQPSAPEKPASAKKRPAKQPPVRKPLPENIEEPRINLPSHDGFTTPEP